MFCLVMSLDLSRLQPTVSRSRFFFKVPTNCKFPTTLSDCSYPVLIQHCAGEVVWHNMCIAHLGIGTFGRAVSHFEALANGMASLAGASLDPGSVTGIHMGENGGWWHGRAG